MDLTVRRVTIEPARLVVLRRRVTFSSDPLAPIIGELYDRLYAALPGDAGQRSGQNVIAYLPISDGTADMLVGRHWDDLAPDELETLDLPAGEAAHARHVGPYEDLPAVHQVIHSWMRQQGLREVDLNWEVYGDWNDDPDRRVTDVFYLLP